MKIARSRGRAGMTAVVVTALSVPLAACGGSEAGAKSCQGATVSAGIVSSATDAVLFIADEHGYFEDEGLDVELVKFDAAAKMIAPMGSGQLDVGAGAPSAGFYNAVGRDIDVRIVADKGSLRKDYAYMPLMVRKDLVDSGKVKTPSDLAGLKVAEPAEATATTATLASILESDGLAYDDVEHQFVGFPEHLTSFQNGAIDASMTTEPTATAIERAGLAVRMFDSTDNYDRQQLSVVLYSGDFAEERSAAAQCFMNAYLRAAEDYSTAVEDGDWNGPEAADVVSTVSTAIGIDPELFKDTVPSYIDPTGAVNVESLEKDYQFFADQGFLEGDAEVDFASLVDTSFIEESASGGDDS